MNREQALDILCAFQEWRRYDGPIGEGPIMPCPKEIWQALDIAIDIMQGKELSVKPLYSFEQLKTMKLVDEEISVRALNITCAFKIVTVADLASWKKEEIVRLRHLGKKTFKELTDLLAKYGLTWGAFEKEKLNA